MAFLSGLLRRLLGGWLSTKNIISERGVQWTLGILFYGIIIYSKIEWFKGYNTFLYDQLNKYLFILCGSISLLWYLTKGHFPGLKCGTEDPDYINEQLSRGRKIPFRKLITWLGKKRRFEEFDKEWCFWQILFIKTLYAIVPSLFLGPQFLLSGNIIGFIYGCMYWVNPKGFRRVLNSPTNWSEFWSGYFCFWGIVLC